MTVVLFSKKVANELATASETNGFFVNHSSIAASLEVMAVD
jgi:hypothetical protein